ncbi:MAG: hypothetical protein WBQ94_04215 [Terracidiphilus sp.]
MNYVLYLKARGWRIYRKPWDGKPAMWIKDGFGFGQEIAKDPGAKAVYQREAIRIERAIERQAVRA